jgi:hypothetical protein
VQGFVILLSNEGSENRGIPKSEEHRVAIWQYGFKAASQLAKRRVKRFFGGDHGHGWF